MTDQRNQLRFDKHFVVRAQRPAKSSAPVSSTSTSTSTSTSRSTSTSTILLVQARTFAITRYMRKMCNIKKPARVLGVHGLVRQFVLSNASQKSLLIDYQHRARPVQYNRQVFGVALLRHPTVRPVPAPFFCEAPGIGIAIYSLPHSVS